MLSMQKNSCQLEMAQAHILCGGRPYRRRDPRSIITGVCGAGSIRFFGPGCFDQMAWLVGDR